METIFNLYDVFTDIIDNLVPQKSCWLLDTLIYLNLPTYYKNTYLDLYIYCEFFFVNPKREFVKRIRYGNHDIPKALLHRKLHSYTIYSRSAKKLAFFLVSPHIYVYTHSLKNAVGVEKNDVTFIINYNKSTGIPHEMTDFPYFYQCWNFF